MTITNKGSANYELSEVQLLPNGELITTASGDTVFIQRPGGDKIARITLSGHFLSFPEGVYSVGQIFQYVDIDFVVESLQLSGHPYIEGVVTVGNDKNFDGRSYVIQARSVSPIATSKVSQLMVGLSVGEEILPEEPPVEP